jgi:hypothetical protein
MKPEMIVRLRELGGIAQMHAIACANSWSTKDRADAYLHRLVHAFYENVIVGANVESALIRAEFEWRKYAMLENRKLATASKFKYGPYAGQSTRMDSYVYPDKFLDTKIHLRTMIRILKEKFGE